MCFYLLVNVVLPPVQSYLLAGECRPSKMPGPRLTSPCRASASFHHQPPCPSLGLGRWERTREQEAENLSWEVGLHTWARLQVSSTCPIFSLNSLKGHISKIKLLRFQDGSYKALKPNCEVLCDYTGPWWGLKLPLPSSSPLSSQLRIPTLCLPLWAPLASPTSLAADRLTHTSQVRSATVPTPSALVQPASALACMTSLADQNTSAHPKVGSVLPRRSQWMSLPTISFLSVLLLPQYTAKGFTKSLI